MHNCIKNGRKITHQFLIDDVKQTLLLLYRALFAWSLIHSNLNVVGSYWRRFPCRASMQFFFSWILICSKMGSITWNTFVCLFAHQFDSAINAWNGSLVFTKCWITVVLILTFRIAAYIRIIHNCWSPFWVPLGMYITFTPGWVLWYVTLCIGCECCKSVKWIFLGY